jgi:hypothetical protein
MSATLPLRTQGVGRERTEVPPGCSSTHLWARFALDLIRRASSESVSPTHGGSFAETTKTRRRVDLWSLGETRIRTFWNSRPETWGSAHCVTRHAPGQSSSVACSHRGCVVHPYGRCMARRVGHGGREARSSGRQVSAVAQIGSGWTWSPVERTRRWVAADRKERSCGAMRPAFSSELSRRSGGFPPSCQ